MRRNSRAQQPLRGVNLGNWLVLERWMETEQHPGPFMDTDADDEYGLRRTLEDAELQARLATHRETHVNADTFAWLADVGCTLVRIPVPFHVFGDDAHESCVDHLDRAMDWAAASRMPVLVDLHTVPGGQNGFDNGGISGLCTWHLAPEHVAQTLSVLERLARRYADHPALWGIEAMNEPASPRIFVASMKRYGANHPGRVEQSSVIPRHVLRQFYRLFYERIRPITGPQVALVLHDQFQLDSWDRFMPADRYPNVWIDTHQYVGTIARALHVGTLRTHQTIAQAIGARIARAERFHPVLVGEWSLSNNLRGITAMERSRRQELMRAYATSQLRAFDRGHGSCFWSLSNARFDTWSLEASMRHGWLDLRTGL